MDDFSHVTHLTGITQLVRDKYALDETDLQIIAVLVRKWAKGEQVRVTDVTLHLGKGIAAPASIHWRLSRDMVNNRFVRLVGNPEDARVKFIIPGKRMAGLERTLREHWAVPTAAPEPTDADKQLELPLEDGA